MALRGESLIAAISPKISPTLTAASGLPLAESVQRLEASADPLVRELAEFARTSKRGFGHAAAAADEDDGGG